MNIQKHACLGVAFMLVVGCAQLPESARSEWRDWRANRHQELLAEDGWLSLVGQFWLQDGEHMLGSDADCEICLDRGPAKLGHLTVAGESVHLRLTNGVDAYVDGLVTEQIELAVDNDGQPPTVVQVGQLSLFVVHRGALALRVRDAQSPYIADFQGLDYFPYDNNWRIPARFQTFDPPREVAIIDSSGYPRISESPGELIFEHEEQSYRLTAVGEPGDALFIMFADKTNAKDTYGAGRFVYASWPQDGATVLDFNRAYNPPCALTEFANCPLPPPGNRLPVTVTAGERRYAGSHH